MNEFEVEYSKVISDYHIKWHRLDKRTLKTYERIFQTEEDAIQFYLTLPKEYNPSFSKQFVYIGKIVEKTGEKE